MSEPENEQEVVPPDKATLLDVFIDTGLTIQLPPGADPHNDKNLPLIKQLTAGAFIALLMSGGFDVRWEVYEPQPIEEGGDKTVRQRLNAMRDRFSDGLKALLYHWVSRKLTYILDLEYDVSDTDQYRDYQVEGVSLEEAEEEARYFRVPLDVR